MERRQEPVKLLYAESGPPARPFDEESGKREQLVVGRRIQKSGGSSHGGA